MSKIQKYRGVKYIIFLHRPDGGRSAMEFYCAYVKPPYKHPFRKYLHDKKTRWGINMDRVEKRIPFDNIDRLPLRVHGGLTFGHYVKYQQMKFYAQFQGFDKGPWIGWDYAHAGDEMWNMPELKEKIPEIYKIEKRMEDQGLKQDHKWGPNEVLTEIYQAIDDLLKIK